MKRTAKIVAPFVVTVAPVLAMSCARSPAECAKTEVDSPCSGKERCEVPGHEKDCGLNGFECHDGKWRELMTYCNPPPQHPEPTAPPTAEPSATAVPTATAAVTASATSTAVVAAATCADTKEDSPCSAGQACEIPGHEHGCGLNGFACRDGKWHRLMTYCNPPRQ